MSHHIRETSSLSTRMKRIKSKDKLRLRLIFSITFFSLVIIVSSFLLESSAALHFQQDDQQQEQDDNEEYEHSPARSDGGVSLYEEEDQTRAFDSAELNRNSMEANAREEWTRECGGGQSCRQNLRFPNKTRATTITRVAASKRLVAQVRQKREDSNGSGRGQKVLRIQVTAIHVDEAEFPLSKLLFKLTLKLALSEANKFLQKEQERLQRIQQQQQALLQSSGGGRLKRTAQPSPMPTPPKVKLALSVRSANTCSRQYASALAAEEYYVKRARLFIVSGCDDAIRGVSRLASDWQVPIMTAAGFGAELNDKRVHRTLVRVAFSLQAAVEFLFKIMKSHAWRRVNLVVDESDPNSSALRGSIEKHMSSVSGEGDGNGNGGGEASTQTVAAVSQRQHQSGNSNNFSSSISLNTIVLDMQTLLQAGAADQALGDSVVERATTGNNSDDTWPNEMSDKVIRDTLVQCSLFSRVTVLLLPQRYLRKFMLSVYDQSMANGMYTFISLPLLMASDNNDDDDDDDNDNEFAGTSTSAQATSEFLWRSAQPRARNAHAKQAFESLMSIYLRTPLTKAYVYFANDLNELASKSASRKSLKTAGPSASNQSTAAAAAAAATAVGNKKIKLNINPYSASFYDSLQIYARALNESLASLRTSLASQDLSRERKPLLLKSSTQQATNNATTLKSTLNHHHGERQLHARISELVRNRRFENMVTGTVYINANGDRETDYTLDDLNQMTGKYAPVILFRGETRDIERLGRIHWSSDPTVGPTSDLVDCYLNGTCASKPLTRFTLLLMLLAAPLLVIMSGLFYFVHSRLSLESQLVDYWWKIHLSDIEIVVTRRKNLKDGSLVTTGSHISSSAGGGGGGPHSQLTTGGGGGNDSQRGPSKSGRDGDGGGGDASTAVGGAQTEVTRATTSGGSAWATSAADVCYGNITLAMFKLTKVALRPISKFHQSRKLMIELRTIKELNHANLCRFKGILVDEGNLAIVSEFCPKGSLRDFFQNESMIIDWTFKYSIINDIMAGLLYLHSSALGFHGRLKSSNCLVSARFVVKLSDYGPHSLLDQVDEHDEAKDKDLWLRKRIWCAPEHMRAGSGGVGASSGSRAHGSMKGDVYSFGLLLYEIITNNLPFFSVEKNDFCMPLKSLYQALKSTGPSAELGPDLSLIQEAAQNSSALALVATVGATDGGGSTKNGANAGAGAGAGSGGNIQPLVDLMTTCWRLEPSKRPSSSEVNASLRRITRGVTSKKLLENLTSRMEQYTNNLESLVEAKLATLVEEKLKTEELLYQFVPKSIASLLREGQFVEPEAFECVTVFYSDIVGFTSLSSESSPMEVVGFLSDLYLCFDETLEQHDIFKVDTIGDAYIVASGLPLPNDGKHVIEIACAALELRDRLAAFKIPHKPERCLEMRVGIHSGPCIAGIVGGLNMPKYCVFGDTLTTGKFMESSGLPMKIHITEESRALLAGVQEFNIEPRLPKITKDGLPFQTYWLEKGDGGA